MILRVFFLQVLCKLCFVILKAFPEEFVKPIWEKETSFAHFTNSMLQIDQFLDKGILIDLLSRLPNCIAFGVKRFPSHPCFCQFNASHTKMPPRH